MNKDYVFKQWILFIIKKNVEQNAKHCIQTISCAWLIKCQKYYKNCDWNQTTWFFFSLFLLQYDITRFWDFRYVNNAIQWKFNNGTGGMKEKHNLITMKSSIKKINAKKPQGNRKISNYTNVASKNCFQYIKYYWNSK